MVFGWPSGLRPANDKHCRGGRQPMALPSSSASPPVDRGSNQAVEDIGHGAPVPREQSRTHSSGASPGPGHGHDRAFALAQVTPASRPWKAGSAGPAPANLNLQGKGGLLHWSPPGLYFGCTLCREARPYLTREFIRMITMTRKEKWPVGGSEGTPGA